MKKESEKESEKRTQKTRFAAEAGASGGGGGFTSRPATSDEVRRIYRLPPLPPTSIESRLSTRVSRLRHFRSARMVIFMDS